MANNFADYFRVDMQAFATIDGEKIPIVGWNVDFTTNRIPEGYIDLPLGRAMSGPQAGGISSAEGILSTLEPFTPVSISVMATATPDGRAAPAGKNPGFPSGTPFVIFEGFARGPAHKKTTTSAVLRVEVMGFLASLAGASQQIIGAVINIPPNGAAIAQTQLGSGAAVTPDLLTALATTFIQDPAADLWGEAIQLLFESVVQASNAWGDNKNTFAAEALAAINQEGGALPSLPLTITGVGSLPPVDLLSKGVSITLADIFYNASDNLWRTLTLLALEFGFKVIPAASEASVAPIFYGLGGDPWRVIDPSEYYGIDIKGQFDENFYSYLTQVALFTDVFNSGQFQDTAAVVKAVGFAQFDPTKLPGNSTGRLERYRASSWLLPPGASPTGSINAGNAIPDASNPDTAGTGEDQGAAETAYINAGLGDAYAQTVLYDKVFAHRSMDLYGRFRADIAPGSLLQVNTAGELFTGKQDTLFAHVYSVSIGMGQEGNNSFAYTRFSLTNVRSKTEHQDFTLPKHPLFGQAWVGGRLSSDVPG